MRGWEFFYSPPHLDRLWCPPSLVCSCTRYSFKLTTQSPSSAQVKNAWSFTSISWHEKWRDFFSPSPRPGRFWSPTSHLTSEYWWINRLGRGADNSPSSGTEVKNASTSLYVLIPFCVRNTRLGCAFKGSRLFNFKRF